MLLFVTYSMNRTTTHFSYKPETFVDKILTINFPGQQHMSKTKRWRPHVMATSKRGSVCAECVPIKELHLQRHGMKKTCK